ncbi:MAG: ATP-binding protein [Planctomycetota bacterium]|nr:ATP-binding protein [Planctomycetota bacterium]
MRGILSRIRNKLLIAFAAVVTLPLVIVAIYGTRRTLEELDRSALEAAARTAAQSGRRLENILAAAQTDLLSLSQDPSLRAYVEVPDIPARRSQLLREAIRQTWERFKSIVEARPFYKEFLYSDEAGVVILRHHSGGRTYQGVAVPLRAETVTDRPFFAAAQSVGPGKILVTANPGIDAITYGTRVSVLRYRSRGIAALGLRPLSILNASGAGIEAEASALIDDRGKRIVSTGRMDVWLDSIEEENPWKATNGAFHVPDGSILAYARITPLHNSPQTWVLVRHVAETDLTGPASSFRSVFTGVLIGALLLALVLSLALSRQLTGPIRTLEEGARRLAAGDLETVIEVESQDELQVLAAEFNRMARQLKELTGGLERKVEEKVAERESLELQLLQSERLSSIGLLAAGVAHEIRNPLAAISMYAQMMEERATDLEDKERLKVILEHIDRISEITRGLLDFSRQTDGGYGSVDLHATLEASMRLFQPSLDEIGVKTEIDLAEDLPLVRGQGTQLQQAIVNILMNATQAMPDGGVIRVGTRHLPKDGLVEIVFEDTGVGIGKKDLGRVFDPFFTTKEPGEGTGLGLAVTYGIINSHGGQIEVSSKRAEGTRVTVRLPVAEKVKA